MFTRPQQPPHSVSTCTEEVYPHQKLSVIPGVQHYPKKYPVHTPIKHHLTYQCLLTVHDTKQVIIYFLLLNCDSEHSRMRTATIYTEVERATLPGQLSGGQVRPHPPLQPLFIPTTCRHPHPFTTTRRQLWQWPRPHHLNQSAVTLITTIPPEDTPDTK